MLSRQIDYWHEAKGMPASLHDQLHRLRVWRNASDHHDGERWLMEGPRGDGEASSVLARIDRGISVLEEGRS